MRIEVQLRVTRQEMRSFARLVTMLVCASAVMLHAEDWPYDRGKDGLGVWRETGILEKFPEDGLASRVRWRTPVKLGYAGAAVADGRVFVTDFEWTTRPVGIERVLALDEQSGKVLWTRDWTANYSGISYDRGPKATPTVDGSRVYVLGLVGTFLCLEVQTGEIVWKKDLVTDYPAPREQWVGNYGYVAPALVDDERVIVKAGGQVDSMVVAFDKKTGNEIWRAVSSTVGPGHSPLIIIKSAGTRQLIVWHLTGVTSLDPKTGKVYWEHPWRIGGSMAVHVPVQSGSVLFLSSYEDGSLALDLDEKAPGPPQVRWKSKSTSETVTDAIHAMLMTPMIIDQYVYGIDSHGELRCISLETGERIWMTQQATGERALHSTAHMIRQGDRVFINNDMGELIIAKLTPEGYNQISRAKLIAPTTPATQRRTGGKVNWTKPAYANRHIIIRNDEEIISVNLAAQ